MVAGSPHRRTRAGAWFAIFTIVSLLMLLASRTEQAVALQAVSSQLLNPVRTTVGNVARGVGGVFGTVGEIDRLRRDNADLRRSLAEAEARAAALGEATHENERLRELLGIEPRLDFELRAAAVVSRDPSNFTGEIGIDAGTDDGVRAGMVVVAAAGEAGGLVGTVSHAASQHARVRLVVDTRTSVIAVDQETRAVGIVEGELGGQLILTGVPQTERLNVGDAVVTAGLELSPDARSQFPKGLLIGEIIAVEQDANGLTQSAFVRPAVDFDALEQVFVITDRGG